ncbi:uncharacterized protein [Aegilops tauschii subsp. strangulata]|uniref:uncharacterized protein n=1 Tax=Aegilops tauschii subsp. strangulata TaxID=200361 RepID=UPI003CC88AC1
MEDVIGRALKHVHERSVVRHELFQEAMGAMSRLGGELADVDALLEAKGLRLMEERHNAKAEASLATSREACSRALEEAREADRRRGITEKRTWELQTWSASLERQVEARQATLALMRGTPAKEEEILKHEEALALEAMEHRLELERLETRERQVAQAEDIVGAREARAQEEVDRRVAEARADLAGRYDLKLKLVESEAAGRMLPLEHCADDKFWRVKYDHEAAKKARKAKKTAKKAAPRKKGSRPTTSELMQLSDSSESEDDTGASNPVVEEVMSLSSDSEPLPKLKVRRVTQKVSFSHPLAYQDPQFILKRQVHESRRHTRTDKSTDLSSGLPDASRKRRTEETSPSSGDSMQSSLPAFKTVPGAQAKITKRAKRSKPVDEPDLPEPKAAAQEPPAASAPEAAAPTTKTTTEAAVNPEASRSAPPADDPDVVITRTEFVEPGRPTVLAKCSAKGELLESRRVNLDLTDYSNLNIGEIVSGFISQVHKSRDAEIAMVTQIQQKSEAAGKKLEADLADLKNRLKMQEMETRKANAKFVSSIAAQEKLKTEFDAERKAWAEEKAALVNRAEQAEKALSEKTAELSGLKRQVSQMVAAIFGPRSANLNQGVVTKLKAVYTLVEQLYTGSQRALAVVALSNEVPTHLAEVLRRLAVLPQRIQELRRASARAGAIAALSRAKAFLPELDPADIALGYPSLKEDGTAFDQKDFAACVKAVRPVATLIGNDTDLTKYQPGYDAENQRIPTPRYEALNLIPPARQHTFAPEIDPAGLIDEEAQFEALSGIDWKSSTFRVLGSAGGEERNELETSTQQAL